MWKAIFAGTTALTLIGGGLAYAQQATQPVPTSGVIAQTQTRFTPEQMLARTDARIGELKAELKLTPAQEKNWPAFETAVRDSAKVRAAHFEEVRRTRETNGGSAATGGTREPSAAETAAQKKLTDAFDPLYKSLDDGQKQRFATMFRVDGEGRHFWFRRGGEHRDNRS